MTSLKDHKVNVEKIDSTRPIMLLDICALSTRLNWLPFETDTLMPFQSNH